MKIGQIDVYVNMMTYTATVASTFDASVSPWNTFLNNAPPQSAAEELEQKLPEED
jgi:hypothetical protein